MKKKGFTLVELLAVIAILAILVIMALPAVLRMFTQARKDSFTNEVNTVIRTARQQYLLSGGTDTEWSNAEGSTKSLDLTGNSQLRYYVKMNNEGKITKLQVTNGDFQYNVTNNAGIDMAESVDVQEVTEENAIDIIVNEQINIEYEYVLNGTNFDSEDAMLQYTTSTYNLPAFAKTIYKTKSAWCIHGSDGWNSCDEDFYFDNKTECENEIQSWEDDGNTYTCNIGSAISQPPELIVGFKLNSTKYYLNPSFSAYESNKQVVINAFGYENCEGDIAMSNTKKSLMNILGIMDVNATNLYVTGTNSTMSVTVWANGQIYIDVPSSAAIDYSCYVNSSDESLTCGRHPK